MDADEEGRPAAGAGPPLRARRVEAASAETLELEAPEVSPIARILERAGEHEDLPATSPPGALVAARFARPEEEFVPQAGGTR